MPVYETPFTHPEVPGIYVKISAALAFGEPDVPHKLVVIGMRLAAGAVAADIPKQLANVTDAETYWGQGSMVAEMARAAFDQFETEKLELWGVGVDEDGLGTASTGDLGVTGTATASGTLSFFVGGKRVRVGVQVNQDAATVIDNAVAELGLMPTLPVIATDGTTTIDFVCRWKGTSGNDIDIRLDPDGAVPAGLDISITAMSGGATPPEVDTALVSLGDAKFDSVAMGLNDLINIGHVDEWLDLRWGPTVMKEGQAFVSNVGDFGTLTTLASSLNSKFITVVAPHTAPSPPWLWAAASAAKDGILTKLQPNQPRLANVLRGIVPAPLQDQFPQDQRDALLKNGISTTLRTPSGDAALERLLTTSTLNDGGFPDTSYRELAIMRLLGRLRYDLQVWRFNFNDWLVSEDEAQAANPKVMTPQRARGFLTTVYGRWIKQSFVQDAAFFSANLIVNVSPNKTDLDMFVPIKAVWPLNAIASELSYI
jgi:phage tail sheath gpL-like